MADRVRHLAGSGQGWKRITGSRLRGPAGRGRSPLVGSLAKTTKLHSEVVLASERGRRAAARLPPPVVRSSSPLGLEPERSMTGRRCTGSNSNR